MFHAPQGYRISPTNAVKGSIFDATEGNRGVFLLPMKKGNYFYFARCLVADDGGWEHVSVRIVDAKKRGMYRVPTWEEMCAIKNKFWDDEDCVVQFHPPASQYVNCAEYCLHLWRPVGTDYKTPEQRLV